MLADLAPQFAFEYDDTTAGSANITTVGTGIAATASGSANTKGSWGAGGWCDGSRLVRVLDFVFCGGIAIRAERRAVG